jgi:chaperonin GroEL
MTKSRSKAGRVLLGSGARRSLLGGMTALAGAVQPALGPHGRLVAVQRETGPSSKAPELLNDGAAIARRIYALPDRWESMGLLMLRHMAAKIEEAVGDGGSTAIVIARALMAAGVTRIAAGCDPMQLRRGLELALPPVLAAIEHVARPIETDRHVVALARAIIGRDDLARLVQECFEIVGPQGVLEVRPSHGVAHDREYVQGVMWNEGWKSSHFATSGGTALLEHPYVLLTTHRLTTATQLAPLMGALIDANAASGDKCGLVVIAFAIEGDALNVLVANTVRGVLPSLAIHAPGAGNGRFEILSDLEALTGGRLLAEEAGHRIETAELADLGRADQVQAIRSAFTITGGKGRPAAIRRRIADIRAQVPGASDAVERDRLIERAGKLLGGAALLRVGGASDAERAHLINRANDAVRVIRIASDGGIVPGGGAAYLAAVPALRSLRLDGDAALAIPMLREALLAPMSALVRNAGIDPGPVVAEAQARGVGAGFDVLRGEFADMYDANIVDPLKVVTTTLSAAVSCTAMALTTEALVHKPRSIRDDDVKLDP